jgi:DNA polymerase-3 subunit delta'
MALSDIKGQDIALRMLTGARKRGRLASSYLFAGEEGIGKRAAAVNFAKALNCLNPLNPQEREGYQDSCDRCPSCLKTDGGTHPDFLAIEPENGMIKVESIRRLEEMLSFKAFEGRMKTVVVDDAETMNASAANAFLKTLEEPAPGSLIVLVSSRPDWLLPTIRSRCSRVNFRPLPPGECRAVVEKKTGKDEGSLVRLSMGRPGLALRADLTKERDAFLASLARMLSSDGKPSWGDRQDMERWMDMCMLLLRDVAVMKITGKAGELINTDRATEVMRMGSALSLDAILERYAKVNSLRASLLFNLNKGITWNYAAALLGDLKTNG